MRVSCCIILLVCPIIGKNLVSIVDRKWQHFTNVSLLIDGTFVQNNQWSNSFSTDSDPYHHFLRKLSFLFLPAFLFTIHRPHTIIVMIAYSVNIKDFFVRKQDFECPFFFKFVLSQFANFFLFNFSVSVIIGTILCLYGRSARSFLHIQRTLAS